MVPADSYRPLALGNKNRPPQSLQLPLLTPGTVPTSQGEMFRAWLPDGNEVVQGTSYRAVGPQKTQRGCPYLFIEQQSSAWVDLSPCLSSDIAVIKHREQKQLGKGRVCFLDFLAMVHH